MKGYKDNKTTTTKDSAVDTSLKRVLHSTVKNSIYRNGHRVADNRVLVSFCRLILQKIFK